MVVVSALVWQHVIVLGSSRIPLQSVMSVVGQLICVPGQAEKMGTRADSTKVNQGLGSKLAVQCVRQFVVHPCISGAVFVSPSQSSKITHLESCF